MKVKILAAFVVLTGIASVAFGADDIALRRFGLYIGSNDGGRDRVTLAYAASDALTVKTVMEEVGGVGPHDSVLLTDPDSKELRDGFEVIKEEIESAKRTNRRVEFLLYYSGHSDDQGILLGGERFTYLDLRNYITTMGADVNIAILDSCSSGALTRLKGGSRQAPFLVDESITTKGHAFITSSSADEAAQESDAIGASFFTHYLVSGLRGAADSTRDGKVTLNEVYTYAYNETLTRTSTTLAGPQHAVHEFSLAGSGDLVLTDLRIASAGITFDESVEGRMFVSELSGRLVAEIRKEAGTPMTLALPPGRYVITLETSGELLERSVALSRSSNVPVAAESFRTRTPEVARQRGDSQATVAETGSTSNQSTREEDIQRVVDTQLRQNLVHLKYLFSFVPEKSKKDELLVIHDLSLKLVGSSYRIEGFDIGLINIVEEDMKGAQIAAIGGIVGDDVYGAQVSGVFSVNEGRLFGAQVSGVLNITNGPVYGGQVAGVLNISDDDVQSVQSAGVFNIASGNVYGFQGAGVFNISEGEVRGAQAGGVFNIANGDVQGGQAAGVFNIAGGDVRGVQAGGVFNIAEGHINGGQVAGVFNISDFDLNGVQVSGLFSLSDGDIHGAQVSGMFNVANDVNGVQISVVNIGGRVYGTQIGLINISNRMYGIPIGLINVSGNGLFDPSVWTDDTGFTYAGMQLGAGPVYTLLFGGTPNRAAWTAASLGFGLGLHFQIGPVHIDTDLSAKSYGSGANLDEALRSAALQFYDFSRAGWYDSGVLTTDFSVYPSLRVHAGFTVFRRVAVLAGLSLEGLVAGQSANEYFHRGNPWIISDASGGNSIGLYPRWFVGLRL